jgi:hypothetical protein
MYILTYSIHVFFIHMYEFLRHCSHIFNTHLHIINVPCPGKGVCAGPRSGDATFGVGGPGPPTTDNERQLSLDRGEEKM